MAVGPPDPTPPAAYPAAPRPAGWTEIFRGFQLALDPRKVLIAAAGVLVMSLGWYLLSLAFNTKEQPVRTDVKYQSTTIRNELGNRKQPDGTDFDEAAYDREADRKFQRDFNQWQTLNRLAGEGGRLRTLPWNEYRGPNPFLLVTDFMGGSSGTVASAASRFLAGTVPVLIEPLVKLLLPVVTLFDPNASTLTRIYLVLCLLWTVAVWAFAGGVITRIAMVQLGGKDHVTLPAAIQYVARRYKDYVLSPIVPVGIVFVVIIAMAIYGMLALIPFVGDVVLYGLGFPLILIGGVVMAILLVGLVGYPLMYSTISAEGSDTFDALSRSYNYVFQAPWSYLWYNTVALLYGSLAVLFVVLLASLTVYLGKFAVAQAPLNETVNRQPDYLFVTAPETFGWRELLLAGGPAAVAEARPDPTTGRITYPAANPAIADNYKQSMGWYEHAGAFLVTAWLVLMLLFVVGFSYSYFWSAASIIYLLMRRTVDETDFDEIYTDDLLADLPPPGSTPPAGVTGLGSDATPVGGVALPTVPPPPVIPPVTAAGPLPTPTPASPDPKPVPPAAEPLFPQPTGELKSASEPGPKKADDFTAGLDDDPLKPPTSTN